MPYNWKKDYTIKKKYLETIGKNIPELPGIYLWTRYDKDINKTYFYVGQAKNLRNRRWDYYKIETGLSWPTRHFEASLKAHDDWQYQIIEYCDEPKLDLLEQYWIKKYMCKDNYITRNDSLTGESTRVTKRDIEKVKAEYGKAFSKILNQLDITQDMQGIHIGIKRNKNESYNKKSMDAFDALMKKVKELIGKE